MRDPRLPPGGAPRVEMCMNGAALSLGLAAGIWINPDHPILICLSAAALFFAGALWTRLFRREAE